MPNFWTEMRKETRLDYYGNPYQVVVFGPKKKDLGQLWEEFKKSPPTPLNTAGHYLPLNQNWLDREAEKQLNHDAHV